MSPDAELKDVMAGLDQGCYRFLDLLSLLGSCGVDCNEPCGLPFERQTQGNDNVVHLLVNAWGVLSLAIRRTAVWPLGSILRVTS
jgi:hypothetical protein